MTEQKARQVYDEVTAVREETGLDINLCFKIARWDCRTYYKAKRMLGIEHEKAGRPKGVPNPIGSAPSTLLNDMIPGNQMVPGIHGLLRIETVIGLESRNISNEFKGKATEAEMREILRQRIRNMTDGKVTVRF